MIGGSGLRGAGSGTGRGAGAVASTKGRRPLSVASRAAPLLIKVVPIGPVRRSRVRAMAAMLG